MKLPFPTQQFPDENGVPPAFSLSLTLLFYVIAFLTVSTHPVEIGGFGDTMSSCETSNSFAILEMLSNNILMKPIYN